MLLVPNVWLRPPTQRKEADAAIVTIQLFSTCITAPSNYFVSWSVMTQTYFPSTTRGDRTTLSSRPFYADSSRRLPTKEGGDYATAKGVVWSPVCSPFLTRSLRRLLCFVPRQSPNGSCSNEFICTTEQYIHAGDEKSKWKL